MGRAVMAAAEEMGHEVVGCLGREGFSQAQWPDADVAIEFTAPESALDVFAACRKRGVPLVSGTTGWEAHWMEVERAAVASRHRMVWSSNFSVGVYLFRKALRHVADVMKEQSDYVPSVHEVHHTGKKDAPSGTAKTLQGDLASMGLGQVSVTAERIAGVPGTHTVEWHGPIDAVQLTHHARGRSGFARGAVQAAEWLMKFQPSECTIFGMDDVWG